MSSRFSVDAIFRAVDRFTAPVSAMQNRLGRFTRVLNSNFQSVNGTINQVTGSLLGMGKTALKWAGGGLAIVTAAAVGLIHEFSKVEDATAAFTPLMGGVDNARKLVEALNKAAADTPFQFETLSDTAKQLLPVMNGDIQKTVDTIKMLGDTAGGNAQKLDSITRGFTKAMLKGKVDLESLNMIGEAGVPIFTALADSMGKKVNPAFFKMISAGKVTTKQLTKAFEDMTSKGGMFFQGMDIASKTTSGMWSTLLDNVSLTAASLGEVLAPTVKELIQSATDLAIKVRNWIAANQEFIKSKFVEYVGKARDVFSRFIDKFSDVNTATHTVDMLVGALLSVAKGIDWLFEHGEQIVTVGKWVLGLVIAFKALAAVMAIVNLVMIANPLGLIVVAIGLAIAAIASAIIWWDELVATLDKMPVWAKAGLMFFAAPIMALIQAIRGLGEAWDWVSQKFQSAGRWLGLIDDANVNVNQTSTAGAPVSPLVVSPQERAAQAISETRTTSTAELLIKDSTGRAELTQKGKSSGTVFNLMNTGAFQ